MAADHAFDAVVIGGGVVGSSMAVMLAALEVCAPERIALVADAQPPPVLDDWDLRVFAIGRASERALRLCGIWERLSASRRFAYERMCVWDAAGEPGGRGSIEFDCADVGEANLGHIVDGRELQRHCLERAFELGVSIIDSRVTSLAAPIISLSNGTTLDSQLIVAADGADSTTRDWLGIETAGHVYHQEALAAHVRSTVSHANTAWQRFTRTGPLAFLPLSDGRCSIVWSTARAEAARLAALDAPAFEAALSQASGGVLGTCTLTTPIARFPLKLQYALDYVRPGAALVGEAAHSVHPLAGQGLNIGLLDCATLADVLRERRRGDRLGDLGVLRRYERRRRGENFIAASALDGLERLFASPDRLVARLRGAGLGMAGRLPFARREFARRALGLAGDIPEFLKIDRL